MKVLVPAPLEIIKDQLTYQPTEPTDKQTDGRDGLQKSYISDN